MSSKKVCVKKSIILALEKLREVLVVSSNQDGEKAKPKRALIKIMINNSVQKPTRKLRPLHTYATNKLFLFTEINAFKKENQMDVCGLVSYQRVVCMDNYITFV